MSENIENLMLEHLKRFQASLDRIEHKQDEHTQRLGRLEMMLARLSSSLSLNDEGIAEHSVRMDRIVERIERIERRLELRDS